MCSAIGLMGWRFMKWHRYDPEGPSDRDRVMIAQRMGHNTMSNPTNLLEPTLWEVYVRNWGVTEKANYMHPNSQGASGETNITKHDWINMLVGLQFMRPILANAESRG